MRKILALFIILSFILSACAPPGAKLNGEIREVESQEEPGEQPEPVEQPEEQQESEEQVPETFEEKQVQCTEGIRECKGDRLIECRSGKLVQKEICGLRGCFDDHCGECIPGVVECVGTDLVTCTEDGRKDIQKCFKCQNEVCQEAPDDPEPFECAGIRNVDVEGAEALAVYSPFKKDTVEQLFILKNGDGQKLGEINHKGQFFVEQGRKGAHPVYIEMGTCYFQCILQFPVKLDIRCDDSSGVSVLVPPHASVINKPLKLFISKNGELYYGDADHDGEGEPLSIEQMFTSAHKAADAPR